MHYQQWLQTFAPMSLFTNEEILNGSSMPDGWFNPYTISQEQIDTMREEFKGSGLDWMRYCQEYLPQLDSKAERKLRIELNKLEGVKRCGSSIIWIDKKGLPHEGTFECKRYELCPRCQAKRQKEHISRLMELDGCRYVFGENATAEYGKDKVYNFTLADGRKVSVIDTDDPGIGCELNHDSILKELTSITVTGTRTSGTLGKEKKTLEKEQRIVSVYSHIIDAPREVKDTIKTEYYQKTKSFLPTTLDELVNYLKRCNAIWLEIAHRHCEKIYIVGKKNLTITEDDIDWSERQSFIEKELNASIKQRTPS